MRKFAFLCIALLILSSFTFALGGGIVSHNPSEIMSGQFFGNYSFMNGSIGIGMMSPQALIDLGGASQHPVLYRTPIFFYDDDPNGPYSGTKSGIYLDQFGLANNEVMAFATSAGNPGSLMFASKNTLVNNISGLIPRVTIQGETGNVGIGTTGPVGQLEIHNNLTTTPQSPLLYLHSPNLDSGNITYGWIGKAASTNNLFGLGYHHVVDSSAYNYFTISAFGQTNGINVQAGGNVGIGTTSPSSKLHVVGNINLTGYVYPSAQIFKARMTSDFSKGDYTTSWQKIPFNSTVYNTLSGTFSVSNNRFTASLPGYYQVSVTGFSSTFSTAGDRYAIGASVNGTLEGFTGGDYGAVDSPLAGYSAIVYLDGVDDYVEIWGFSQIAAIWKGPGSTGHEMLWYMNYLGR